MAHDSNLPCDGEGRCMICKTNPPEVEKITCKTCVTPWHLDCLSARPQTLADAAQWECPDCSNLVDSHAPPSSVASGSEPSLVASIRAIESDVSLSDQEKAKRRQQLLSGKESDEKEVGSGSGSGSGSGGNDVLKLLSGSFNCSFCMQLPERPVTTPCGHNFCLKCFEKWVGQGKKTCAICRTSIPPKMASQPRINSSLVIAIRMAKMTRSNAASGPPKPYYSILNQNKPDKAYTTERAKKTGKANACSGKIFVTVPPDHFGPILAENDPERGMGVLVGETWEDRLECRQWGAHLPHVAGICGQSDYGAQSVALSGGYEDDEDHGEWFLYTGSGGRDLSGNKRTNKTQSFDQKFDKSNEALRVSCKKGYPVRVVRSHKEKRSAYAPEQGVRYDGVYRIEKCWRKPGIQGYKVCRYLFVRCDNDPAPWTSDENGDRPRPLPIIKELKDASDVTERKGPPSWDYDEEKTCWQWKTPPPESRKKVDAGDGTKPRVIRRKTQMMSVSERLLKEFCCLICHKVMNLPLTTPCAHNFCKSCLQDTFTGQTFIKERNCEGRRTLRAQKNIMKCPSCTNDISEYLQNPQVNRELMSVIESLQRQIKEVEENAVLEEEMMDKDEKSDVKEDAVSEEEMLNEEDKNDVKEDPQDSKSVIGVNNACSEATEDFKESDEKVVAKPSPKANRKRKAKTDVKMDAKDNKSVIEEDIKGNGENEVVPKPSPKASKKGKAKSDAKVDAKDNKSAIEVKDVPSEAMVDIKESGETEVVAKPTPKANKKGKAKAKNDVKVDAKDNKSVNEVKDVSSEAKEDIKESGENEVVAKPTPKANKKRKAKNDVEVDTKDNKLVIEVKDVSSEAKESGEDEVVANPTPKANKKRKAKNDVKMDAKDNKLVIEVKDTPSEAKEDIKESGENEVVAKPSPKANKKRKAAKVTGNAPNKKQHVEGDVANDSDNQIIKDAVVNAGSAESEDVKVDKVGKRGKKASRQKKDNDGKCSSPTSAGARTRSKKA